VRAAARIDLPDRHTPGLFLDSVFSDIAVGPDAHVQLRAVGTGNHVRRPMVVEWAIKVETMSTGAVNIFSKAMAHSSQTEM